MTDQQRVLDGLRAVGATKKVTGSARYLKFQLPSYVHEEQGLFVYVGIKGSVRMGPHRISESINTPEVKKRLLMAAADPQFAEEWAKAMREEPDEHSEAS